MATCRRCQKPLTQRDELLGLFAVKKDDLGVCEECQWAAVRRRNMRVVK